MTDWEQDFDPDDDDPWADDDDEGQDDFIEEAIEEVYEHLDEMGSAGDWHVTITLDDGTEHSFYLPIELVWDLRDFAIEYGLDFDYEYEGG